MESAELLQLGAQFEIERDEEYARICAATPPAPISPHNPSVTHRWDNERRNTIQAHMIEWTRDWWRQRGYLVTRIDDDQFTVIPLEEA